jgi:hypothetical protein
MFIINRLFYCVLSPYIPVDHSRSKDTEAIMYFDFLLPRLKEAYPDVAIPEWQHEWVAPQMIFFLWLMSQVRSYEGLQHPGDIIFVPGDWWHGVLNLEEQHFSLRFCDCQCIHHYIST